jgi:hypothetical protein
MEKNFIGSSGSQRFVALEEKREEKKHNKTRREEKGRGEG